MISKFCDTTASRAQEPNVSNLLLPLKKWLLFFGVKLIANLKQLS